jgi:hypothetical protein
MRMFNKDNKMRKENDEAYIKVIIKILCMLLHNRSLNLEASRILNFALSVAISGKSKLVDELLINIYAFSNVVSTNTLHVLKIGNITLFV